MPRSLAVLLLVPLVLRGSCAEAQHAAPHRMEQTGTLTRAGIHESSGVAVSRRYPGVLWTHNDSGDGPMVYAVTLQGDLLASFEVNGARAEDWEDIALGPCPAGVDSVPACLFIADTGDNFERRANVTLYVVPEPDPRGAAQPPHLTQPAHAITVRYASGPQDVEAAAVDADGALLLVTKGRSGPIVLYTVPKTQLLQDSVVLSTADTVPIVPFPMVGRWITGAAVSPSGRRAVLRTHTELFFFEWRNRRWESQPPPCWLQGREPQGEAVDFLDEALVVTTSERAWAAESPIFVVGCPGA